MALDAAPATIDTLADLIDRLGGVPLQRVRFRPPPGMATERDVLDVEHRENRLCELVDGVLVEKPMGYRESLVAGLILTFLNQFVLPRDLGFVTGEAGMIRLFPGLVRIPDVAFASRSRFRDGGPPRDAIPEVAPELVVEVLSRTNTAAEMRRKREEYFQAGVQLVWIVDSDGRSVTVYTASDRGVQWASGDVLHGEPVLPGFRLPLTELFRRLDE